MLSRISLVIDILVLQFCIYWFKAAGNFRISEFCPSNCHQYPFLPLQEHSRSTRRLLTQLSSAAGRILGCPKSTLYGIDTGGDL